MKLVVLCDDCARCAACGTPLDEAEDATTDTATDMPEPADDEPEDLYVSRTVYAHGPLGFRA